MPVSFAEAFQRLEEGRQRRAVWTQVVDFLNRCVATEVKEARDKIIPDGCVAKEVPQELILEILQEIEADKIAPLDEEIELLENLEVVETKKNEPKTTKSKRPKATAKKNQKAVRIVPPTARAAGGGSNQKG